MVIGGLMEQNANNTDTGIPFVSGVPWLGNLFKGVEKDDTMRELIIFIRATIIGSNGHYQDSDRAIYKKFSRDPRPLTF